MEEGRGKRGEGREREEGRVEEGKGERGERGKRGEWKKEAFIHKGAPMDAFYDSLPTNSLKYCTNDNIQWSHWAWKLKF